MRHEDTDLETIYMILGMTMNGDTYEEGLDVCKKFIRSDDDMVRRAAIEGLGHLARIYGKIDLPFAVPELKDALKHPLIDLSGTADDVLADFEMFLPDFIRTDYGFPKNAETEAAEKLLKRLDALETDDDEN